MNDQRSTFLDLFPGLMTSFDAAFVDPTTPASVAEADRWCAVVTRIAHWAPPQNFADALAAVSDEMASALVTFSFRASEQGLEDRRPWHLIDAVLALHLAAANDARRTTIGLDLDDIKRPFYAAYMDEGSLRTLWEEVEPVLTEPFAGELARHVQRWEAAPQLLTLAGRVLKPPSHADVDVPLDVDAAITHVFGSFERKFATAKKRDGVDASDQWSGSLVRLYQRCDGARRSTIRTALTGPMGRTLIRHAKRMAERALQERRIDPLVDAVIALDIAGLQDPDGVEAGMTVVDLRMPVYSALVIDGSVEPLLERLTPLLDPDVWTLIGRHARSWQDDPVRMDVGLARDADGILRYHPYH